MTEFSEVRPQEWGLRSGERHRCGAAQGKSPLRGQDDRRVRTLYPPKLRRWPLVYRFLYGRRLDHQLAGVEELGQTLLLLQGTIQVNRLHPVEGGPNGAPVAALLLNESPELVSRVPPRGSSSALMSSRPSRFRRLASRPFSSKSASSSSSECSSPK